LITTAEIVGASVSSVIESETTAETLPSASRIRA
jgi:hypothetical protein